MDVLSTLVDIQASGGAAVLRRMVSDAPTDIRDMLLALASGDEELTVTEALDPVGLIEAISDMFEPDEVLALVNGLRRWAAQSAVGRDVQPRGAATEMFESLSEVAESLGVAEYIHAPLSVLAPLVGDGWVADNLRWYSVSLKDAERSNFGQGGAVKKVRAAALQFLKQVAPGLRDAARERARVWDEPVAEPKLAQFSAALRAELVNGLVGPGPVPPVSDHPDLSLVADLVNGRVAVCLRNKPAWHLQVVGFGRPGVALMSTEPYAGHARWAIGCMLDAVHDAHHALHAPLAAMVTQPAWELLLQSLAVNSTSTPVPKSGGAQRLSFRIDEPKPGHWSVSACLHKATNSGWSRGAQVKIDAAERVHGLTKEDRRVLSAMSRARLHGENGDVATTLLPVLDELAEHPHVHATAPGSPALRLERVSAALALIEQGDDLALGVRVGQRTLSAGEGAARLREGGVVMSLDAEGGVLQYGVIAAELRPLLEGAVALSAAIPRDAWHRLIDALPAAALALGVELPESLASESLPADLQVVLRVSPEVVGARAELLVRCVASLPPMPAGHGACALVESRTAGRVLRVRDLEAELRAARETASALGLALSTDRMEQHLPTDDDVLAVLDAARAQPGLEVEWPDARLRVVGRVKSVSVSVKGADHWFSVGGNARVDEHSVALATLLTAVRNGERFVKLGPGRFASIDRELRARLERAADVLVPHGKSALGITATAGDVLEALAGDGALEADARWTAQRASLLAPVEAPTKAPRALKATLRDYQLDGFRWLHRLSSLDVGGILADDMGLGKTVQALAILLERAKRGPALIVAPTSLSDNWLAEATRFAPSLRVHLYRGADREALLEKLSAGDVLVASYDIVAMDIERLAQLGFATLIADEAQALKNANSQRARAVARLRASWRLALTGTPIENRVGDLWSIFSIVQPGLLGSWEHFRERFERPIARDQDRERLERLSSLVRPYILRRRKDEVARDLPPRIELTRTIELSDDERTLYEAQRRTALDALAGAGANEEARFAVLAAITRLRQLACDPALVHAGTRVRSSKLDALIELLDDVHQRGGRALVFSQFTSLLARVRLLLDERGMSYLELDGSTPAAARAKRVAAWQTGTERAFLISLKAGGTGLNLTGADWVVHLDPWWNPAVEDQATDRAHRIGQGKTVTVVRLVAQGTIEEAVLALHGEKRALARGVLEGAETAGKLSAAELVSLIRAGAAEDAEVARSKKQKKTR